MLLTRFAGFALSRRVWCDLRPQPADHGGYELQCRDAVVPSVRLECDGDAEAAEFAVIQEALDLGVDVVLVAPGVADEHGQIAVLQTGAADELNRVVLGNVLSRLVSEAENGVDRVAQLDLEGAAVV